MKQLSLSIGDDVSTTFVDGDKVIRRIEKRHVGQVRKLFESGLMATLVEHGLMIEATLVEVPDSICVEQPLVAAVTYPCEWSFDMLKDAAALVLKINEVAGEYGYQTKDCHPHNILYVNSSPRWVDVGSLIALPEGVKPGGLSTYPEFLSSYLIPLKIWSKVGDELGRRLSATSSGVVSPSAYTQLSTLLWPRPLAQLAVLAGRVAWSIGGSSSVLNAGAGKSARRTRLAKMLNKLGMDRWINDFARLHSRLEKFKISRSSTAWHSYQEDFTADKLGVDHRFNSIAEALGALQVRTLVDLAGNRGRMAIRLVQLGVVREAVCVDYDSEAVNSGYCESRSVANSTAVTFAVCNPFNPNFSGLEMPPHSRLARDVVIALAVTHHLLLTQRYRLDHVVDTIAAYGEKSALIEFMPLGLWDGVSAPPIPDWYSEDWFVKGLLRRFSISKRLQLEPNRVLFVCDRTAVSNDAC